MGDECPGHTINARITLEVPRRKLRQLPIKARWQVVVDFAKLFFHHEKIVDQPLSGGRDGLFALNGASDIAVVIEQKLAVFSNAFDERLAGIGAVRDRLCSGEALGVLFEPIDAEQFADDGFVRFGEGADRRCGAHCGL